MSWLKSSGWPIRWIPRLNDLDTDTHRLRIFGTQHGLGVLLPKAMLSA